MQKRGAPGDEDKDAKKRKLLEEIGNGHLQYFSSKDESFYELWRSAYSKIILLQAKHIPENVHQSAQKAFLSLFHHGCLFRDLVRLKGKDILTPVSRILIGNPGCTYKYLNTRLFAVPWGSEDLSISHTESFKAFSDLNEFLYSQTLCELQNYKNTQEDANIVESSGMKGNIKWNQNSSALKDEKKDICCMDLYNVTLINYMDPQDMDYLKEEPYFGMGKMAVSWHHDENLVEQSTVAVYNYTYEESASNQYVKEDPTSWHVGLKIAWDAKTPGLIVPLNSGDSYFMLDDFNQTHQHCVLAGFQPRFSSTHRVAECSRGTLKYIKSRCHTALENLCMNTDTEEASLNTLQRSVLYQTEEIHNEVEFEWLRQFWFQGKRYNKCTNFWMAAMTDLEDLWKQMEMMTSLVLKAIEKRSHAPEATCRILKTILPLLLVRQNLREEWRQRCMSKLAKSLPPDQKPRCYPYWKDGDPSMPLPFDLHSIISKLQTLVDENTDNIETFP